MYHSIFIKQFIFITVLMIVGVILLATTLFNERYWEKFKKVNDDKLAKCLNKAAVIVFYIMFVIYVYFPIVLDKQIIDDNNYSVLDCAIVKQDIVEGGAFGLLKSIIVEQDGIEYELSVLKVEGNIKKDDIVKVTYLPNSKYAVIEKITESKDKEY